MSEVRFEREHTLGLDKARALAQHWAEGASQKMGLTCRNEDGPEQSAVRFERMGVNGTLTVTATRFDLYIKLGMMMAAFKPMIEAEVTKNLGRILDRANRTQPEGDQA